MAVFKIPQDLKWILGYAIVHNLNIIGHATLATAMGPAQPYLAHAVGVDIDTISWTHTVGGISGYVSAFITSRFFKFKFKSGYSKMMYFFILNLLQAIFVFFIPITRYFSVLLLISSIKVMIGWSCWVTMDNLYVHVIGPIRSRVFVQVKHFTYGLGFMFGPFVIKPFFPKHEKNSDICNSEKSNTTISNEDNFDSIMNTMQWPFYIMGVIQVILSFGYLMMAFNSVKMPVYEEEEGKKGNRLPSYSKKQTLLIIVSVVCFYFSSCSAETVFRTYNFTFGLCGPLNLFPSDAVITDKVHFFGFTIGRLIVIFIVNFITPKNILRCSIIGCFLAAVLISWKADESAHMLYICAAIFGLFASWEYGSAYSWIAEHIDVVGKKSPLFAIGCGTAGMVSPVAAGYLFKRVDPMAMWYYSSMAVILQILSYSVLDIVFNKESHLKSVTEVSEDIQYSKLNTFDVDDLESDDE